jgi:hypothetical protein
VGGAPGTRGATAARRVDSAWRPDSSGSTSIDAYPAGTTFVLKAGVHRMQTIRPRSGDTFVGETSAGALVSVLSGARVLNAWRFDGRRWYAEGQTQAGVVAEGGCVPSHPRCNYPEDLFFDNVQKHHRASLDEVGPGAWFFDRGASRIYVGDDPNGHTVETSVTPQLFELASVVDVTLRNVIVEKFASPTANAAVNLGGSAWGAFRWTIEGCEVRWNHGAGIGQDIDTTARGNLIHHNCGLGLHGAGSGVLVEGNEIAYNNVAAGSSTETCGYDGFWGAGGSKWVYTDGLVVRNNYSHHNDGPGLWTDINNIHSTYEGNVVEYNVRGGIFHEISYDATIRNNTLRYNGTGRHFPYWTTGAGIEIVSSRNVEVYGNTLVDNWQGITALDDHRGVGIHGPYTVINLDVHDNDVTTTFADEGGGRTGLIDYNSQEAFSAAANNHFTANRYVLGPNRWPFTWMGELLDEAAWRAFGNDVTGSFRR